MVAVNSSLLPWKIVAWWRNLYSNMCPDQAVPAIARGQACWHRALPGDVPLAFPRLGHLRGLFCLPSFLAANSYWLGTTGASAQVALVSETPSCTDVHSIIAKAFR